MSDHPIVSAVGLSKRFGQTVAVDRLDMEVGRGEVFGILGPNGAGKSTTMRMIGCVSRPTAGRLTILGMDHASQGPEIRMRMGVIPQDNLLDQHLSVRENLTTYARYFGMSRADARRRAADLLDFVQLSDRALEEVQPLSGGMKRRLAIARALVNDPELVLLDEPTTGLDPQARHLLWERLFQLKDRGTTLVLTTHYMDEAEQLCDRLVIMNHGRIVDAGSPRSLIDSNLAPHVLELRFAAGPLEDYAGKIEACGLGVERLPDRLLVFADDADTAAAEVSRCGVTPSSMLTRRSTLEDVFLKQTGRTLVD